MTSGLWGKGICQMVLVTVLCCIRQLLEELQGLAGILATLTLSVALTHMLHSSGISMKLLLS